MQQLNKDVLQTQRQKTSQQESEFIAVNSKPAALKKFEIILYKFFVVCVILHTVLFISAMVLSQTFNIQTLIYELTKCCMKLLWMLVILNSTKNQNWQSYIILYAAAGYNFVLLLNDRAHLIESILMLPHMKSGYMLLYGSILLLEIMFPFLLLISAICLMIISKHRKTAKKAE